MAGGLCRRDSRFWNSAWMVVVIFAMTALVFVDATCQGSLSIESSVTSIPIEGEPLVRLLLCKKPSDEAFENGTRVIVSKCVDGHWTHGEESCYAQSGEEFSVVDCGPLTAKPPEGSDVSSSLDESYAVLYRCIGQNTWLSGETFGRLSQCINGAWTPVADACAEECADVIRDCSDVARYISESGVFTVFPDGNIKSDGVEVWCDLEDSEHPGGSGWTVLMRAVAGNSVFQNLPADNFSNAINDPTDDNYFLGFNTLLQMNWNDSETPRSLALQVLFSRADSDYHITYNNFVVDDNYSLLSVGDCFGSAWDKLYQHVGYPFWKPDNRGAWWAPTDPDLLDEIYNFASWLTESTPRWKLWDTLTLTGVKLRFRPQSYDNEVNCPVDIDFSGKYYDRPFERLPGTLIEFSCAEDLHYMKGPADELYTSGSVECLSGTGDVGGFPKWNDTLNLPCEFSCPNSFVASHDENYCYNFTKIDQPNFGFVSGALTCAKLNASLAFGGNMADLDFAESEISYFSAYNYRSENNITDPLPSSLTCLDVCEVTDTAECITLSEGGYYGLKSCSDSYAHVVCQFPGSCPSPYVEHRGLCYRVIDTGVSDLLSAQAMCNQDGASLAYPEDMDALNFITQLVKTSLDPTGTEIIAAIGLNEFLWNDLPNGTVELVELQKFKPAVNIFMLNRPTLGDWTFNGLYSPSDDVTDMAGVSPSLDQLWRFLVIHLPSSSPLDLIPASLESDNVSIAICQLYGPISCLTSPPEPPVNMTRMWDAVSEVALYECLPGYFVEGNISETQQNITCIGGLGEWYPQLKNCIAVEVCLEPLSEASKTLENSTDLNFRFLNGIGDFFCPEDMATVERNTTQTLTCSFNGSDYAFDPPTVLPCDVCISEPLVNNSEVQWTIETIWTVGTAVVADCLPGHMLNISSNTQEILCTETGWEVKEGCYAACGYDPPEAGSNMVRGEFVSNSIGAVLVYTCFDGYFIPPTEIGKEPENWTSITCMPNNTWAPDIPSCSRLCLDDPISPSPPINSNWDGIDRKVGSEVVLSCPSEHYFPDMNQTLPITCEEDGLWTTFSSNFLKCRKPAPGVLPEVPEGAILEQNQTRYWVGDIMNFTCEPPRMSESGATYVTVESTNEGWLELDPLFACHNVCLDAPPSTAEGVTYNYTGVSIWGTRVVYECQGIFLDHSADSFSVTCVSGNWSHSVIPFCGKL